MWGFLRTFTPESKKLLQTMINRILIRIKVLQIVYSFYQCGDGNLKTSEKELLFSLKKSYDLYHYLLVLLIDITRLYERIIDNRKHRIMPSEEDMHPNTRLVDNRFIKQLSQNEGLAQYVAEHKLSWDNDPGFVRNLLDILLASDMYANYIQDTGDSYKTDREFWRAFFRKYICGNEMVEHYLEDKSIYWNDDIDIVETFTLKTIKQFDEASESKQPLLPMFKDEEDREFALKLFRQTLLHGDEYRKRIDKHIKNWETERIAHMDLLIMQVALAEITSFPSIPINVSLNEYIDAAKYYSTPKSGIFINGILDSIVNELKKEKVLLKT
jgi:N utilization substance protein B